MSEDKAQAKRDWKMLCRARILAKQALRDQQAQAFTERLDGLFPEGELVTLAIDLPEWEGDTIQCRMTVKAKDGLYHRLEGWGESRHEAAMNALREWEYDNVQPALPGLDDL